ncbi:MAG: nicotinate phosphoribosyltransferase [Sulfurimonas sp. RIFOXYD12_FULL_33_39]|uniref:phosphoribosyltransferase n=1 Tax=unclassified Sulfurimonas TaxID=2623549 RepID=UPI0008D87BEB|nr:MULTISPECIES: phosphoribosyltransferase family protein [unclassified Sulfurimonas]OHE02302.1 MAG: nicotinate phosphoribosyltransferase [Sulfurimonas sp. RIFCSPLOWO2_12_FULL_34_6]OHE10481.1 MAG: nicotinate phosphoribosyltransferase [Sulfurimonas sp. RIFOXYD12_FULL_33_39]OHE14940.1 MAG: nicotinate phosphoribosyltransferase [Sulfurimonas sp. RIFOXYD2_FULL_34_21]DAB28230.1 MAG TPA: nicotinate phosphoribosyltransferase [Sulfurimonas sp. UBA10385]
MKYYSYENFKNDTNILIKKVKDSHFEAIVAIARGGLTLSHAMAEGLNIRQVQSIRTELYDKSLKRENITIFGNCEFKDVKKVLVVDDISDSGDTLKAVMEHLGSEFKDIEFVSCTLFYKKTSIYEPHFWVNEADDWIDFFWERDFLLK